jgi:hypothetical protein
MSPDSGPPRNLRGWSSVVVVHRLGEAASPSRGLGETGVSTGMVFIGAPHDFTKEQAINPGDPSGMMWHWICSSRNPRLVVLKMEADIVFCLEDNLGNLRFGNQIFGSQRPSSDVHV